MPLQICQQRKTLFELFQILVHGAVLLSRSSVRERLAAFPGEDGGWLDFFRAAKAKTDGGRRIEFAGTAASSPGEEVCLHPATGIPRAGWGAKTKPAAERNPNFETIGAEWRDPPPDGDL